VLDKSKANFVEGVRVFSTSGKIAITDSTGHYLLKASEADSIYFVYNGKPTQKFAIKTIPNPSQFDVSIHIDLKGKTNVLQEVVVFGKTYKQDSLENRINYAKAFNFRKAQIETSTLPGGGVGFDANELFGMFRFKYNKSMRKLQERVEIQEQERYVKYRFNKTFVQRVTQLKGAQLDTFMVRYKPSFLFCRGADEITFNQYLLNCSYQYKAIIARELYRKQE
jgi:hypothetical protein